MGRSGSSSSGRRGASRDGKKRPPSTSGSSNGRGKKRRGSVAENPRPEQAETSVDDSKQEHRPESSPLPTDSLTAAATTAAPVRDDPAKAFPVGTQVRIKGLEKKKHNNGKIVEIKAYVPDKGRFTVVFFGGGTSSLRAENLEAVENKRPIGKIVEAPPLPPQEEYRPDLLPHAEGGGNSWAPTAAAGADATFDAQHLAARASDAPAVPQTATVTVNVTVNVTVPPPCPPLPQPRAMNADPWDSWNMDPTVPAAGHLTPRVVPPPGRALRAQVPPAPPAAVPACPRPPRQLQPQLPQAAPALEAVSGPPMTAAWVPPPQLVTPRAAPATESTPQWVQQAPMVSAAPSPPTVAQAPPPEDGDAWGCKGGKGKAGWGKGRGRASSAPPDVCRGGKGGGRGGGGGKSNPRDFRISKAMTSVLRHNAEKMGINIRPDGYCAVEEVLNSYPLKNLSATVEELQAAVASNDKKRFEVNQIGGELYVRATQGHSIQAVEDDVLLHRLVAGDPRMPSLCVHGTYARHLSSIRQHGLVPGGDNRGGRKHVHFAPFAPGDGRVISGMRANCELALFIDVRKAVAEGVPFFLSTNEVILSPGLNGAVPFSYVERIVNLVTGEDLPRN